MSTVRGGVGGRQVPGAELVDDRSGKKKKRRGKKHNKPAETVDSNGIEPEAPKVVEAGSDSSGFEKVEPDKPSDSSTNGDGFIDVHHEERPEQPAEGDSEVTPKAAQHEFHVDHHEDTRPSEMDDMPISSDQMLHESKAGEGIAEHEETAAQEEEEEEEAEETDPVKLWLKSKTEHPYKTMSRELKIRVVEHLQNHVPDMSFHDPIWMRQVRETIWRAVVRSNYWWVNPDTGEVGKQEPVQVNEGVWLNHFEAFVECAAARQDRVGRDIATHDYVHKVEADVRGMIMRAEKAGLQVPLQHLAFLLMVDESRRTPRLLTLEDMQERIALAFKGARMDWRGLHYMRAGAKLPSVTSNERPGASEAVWRQAMAELDFEQIQREKQEKEW